MYVNKTELFGQLNCLIEKLPKYENYHPQLLQKCSVDCKEKINKLALVLFEKISTHQPANCLQKSYFLDALKIFVIKTCCSTQEPFEFLLPLNEKGELIDPPLLLKQTLEQHIQKFYQELLKEDKQTTYSKKLKTGLGIKEMEQLKKKLIAKSKMLQEVPPANREIEEGQIAPLFLCAKLIYYTHIFETILVFSKYLETLHLYRKYSYELKKNPICSFSLGIFEAVFDRMKLKTAAGEEFHLRLEYFIEKIGDKTDSLSREEKQELERLTKHPEKNICQIAKFILMRSQIFTTTQEVGDKLSVLICKVESLLECSQAKEFKSLTLFEPERSLLVSHKQVMIKKLNTMLGHNYTIMQVTDDTPANTEIGVQAQLIKEWIEEVLPIELRHYQQTLQKLKMLRDQQKSRQEKIAFTKTYLSTPAGFAITLIDYPNFVENFCLSSEKVVISQKKKKNKKKALKKAEKGSSTKGKINCAKEKKEKKCITVPDPILLEEASDSFLVSEIESEPSKKEKRAKTSSEPPILHALPLKEALPPIFQTYDPRVERWFSLTPLPLQDKNTYGKLSARKKIEQHFRHGFAQKIDEFVSEFSFPHPWLEEQTGRIHICHIIWGILTKEDGATKKTSRINLVYCADEKKVLYHRYLEYCSGQTKYLEISDLSKTIFSHAEFPTLHQAMQEQNSFIEEDFSTPYHSKVSISKGLTNSIVVHCHRHPLFGSYAIELLRPEIGKEKDWENYKPDSVI